ncbi:hypothetical protein [Acidisphaera sp. S103]|uniref:hypothetical protein n=1 Tax=Acidisphaera sp. S103 TaxID=1747223 RepID=UPI00131E4F3E|nr:hypothetical protein [Acidisphaera sp. S103]
MKKYLFSVIVFFRLGGIYAWLVVAGWLAVPVILQTLIHPRDAVGLRYFIEGLPQPLLYSTRGLVTGVVLTVFVAGLVIFSQIVFRVLICRKMQARLRLSPLAAILIGIIGNATWYFSTGYYDSTGAFAGAVPGLLMFMLDHWVEKTAADFLFGPNDAPEADEVFDYADLAGD